MQESHYWDLIKKHYEQRTSESEEEELVQWINLDKKNKEDYDIQMQLWRETTFQPIQFEADKAWNSLESRIKETKQGKVIPFRSFLKIAATIVLVLVAGLLFREKFFATDNMITVVSPENDKLRVVLPDNSVVWLNKNSEMKYPRKFEKGERNVLLIGEAFFEIQQDKKRPFKISAQQTVIEVLGTSFNVEALPEENAITVSVLTGKVAFYDKDNKVDRMVLTPGNRGFFDKESKIFVEHPADVSNEIAWKTGVLKFKNTPLSEVIAELEEMYSKDIVVKNNDILSCSVTSQFEHATLEKVLAELQLILSIEYSQKEDKVILAGGNCH